jgi:glycosyltransferase involved in cell wall biosynthesis
MRILLASRNFFPANTVGGAQLSVSLLGQELARQGHEVAVVSVDDHEHQGVHEPSGLYEYRLALRNLYSQGKAPAWKKAIWHTIDRSARNMTDKYRAVLSHFRPDIINTNVLAGMGLGIWTAARDMSVPIIHTVHDYYLLCIRSGMRRDDVNCVSSCESCSLAALRVSRPKSAWVSEVIFVSDFVKQMHLAGGLFSRRTGYSIIHGSYRPDASVPQRHDGLNRRLRIGFFGRIAPDKGLDRLISALKTLPDGEWELRVGGAGDSAYVEQLQALAAGSPVTFLGVQKPADFYSKSDLIVIPSLWNDPAPRVAYEAGILGCIPVVANRGGLPELVDYGRRGFVFEPEDPTSLSAALKSALADPARLETIRADWRAQAFRFDPTYVAEQTVAIYERAITASSLATAS